MMTRRHLVKAAGAAACLTATTPAGAASPAAANFPVRFALNTSTVRGQGLSIIEQVDLAAKAGYDGIEPWIGDIQKYAAGGGSLPELRDRIADAGITVDSAIGFAQWIVDDDDTRNAALIQAREEMELVKSIGGRRVAAPPVGLKGGQKSPTLAEIARRYRALLEVGDQIGMVPQLELWGFAPTLSKLSELAYVATEAAHPNACVLPDFYHIYKGGNDFESLGMIEASRMHCFHINDYPAAPPLESIADKDRVFPGDGICPLPKLIRQLIDNGFQGTFSLELFNPEYWKRDAMEVAAEGLQKSKRVVATALV